MRKPTTVPAMAAAPVEYVGTPMKLVQPVEVKHPPVGTLNPYAINPLPAKLAKKPPTL